MKLNQFRNFILRFYCCSAKFRRGYCWWFILIDNSILILYASLYPSEFFIDGILLLGMITCGEFPIVYLVRSLKTSLLIFCHFTIIIIIIEKLVATVLTRTVNVFLKSEDLETDFSHSISGTYISGVCNIIT